MAEVRSLHVSVSPKRLGAEKDIMEYLKTIVPFHLEHRTQPLGVILEIIREEKSFNNK